MLIIFCLRQVFKVAKINVFEVQQICKLKDDVGVKILFLISNRFILIACLKTDVACESREFAAMRLFEKFEILIAFQGI